MATESTLTYRSKIDWWQPLLVAALLVQGFLILRVYEPLSRPLNDWAGWLIVGIGVLAALAMLGTSYKITDTQLIVRYFLVSLRIPLESIEKVTHRRAFAVRLGRSTDAIEIKYRTNRTIAAVVISPKDKGAFLRHLSNAASGLVVPTTAAQVNASSTCPSGS